MQAAIVSPRERDVDVRAAALATPGPKLSSSERVAIYRRAYWARLVEVLHDDFPTLAHALGEEAFDVLACEYLARFPSESADLAMLGRNVAAHCRSQGLAFAADVATLEWAIVEVIHSPLAPPSNALAVLAAMPSERWGELRFEPGSASRVVELEHPANAYWQAVADRTSPSVPAPEWSCTAIYRQAFTVWRWDIDRAMARVLLPLLRGASLAEALANADESANVGAWFREWTTRGLLIVGDTGA